MFLTKSLRPNDLLFPVALDEAADLMSGEDADYDDVVAALLAESVNHPESIRWTVFTTDSGEYRGHACVRDLPPCAFVLTCRIHPGDPSAFRRWRDETVAWARSAGRQDVVWWTTRNPEAFDRATGGQHYTTMYRLELGPRGEEQR